MSQHAKLGKTTQTAIANDHLFLLYSGNLALGRYPRGRDWQPIHTTNPPLHRLHPLPMGGSASLWNGKPARAASAVAPMQKGTVS